MKLIRIAALTTLILMPFKTEASDNNVGTSGAQFLRIGAGARPTAMGDAFVGIADDVNAAYFNPAGLSRLEKMELTAMHTQWFQDMNYDFAAFVHPGKHGALAISAMTLNIEDLQKRDVDESDQGTFQELDAAYGLSYAHNFGSRYSGGITARYLKQEIDTASANTLSFDVGLFRRPKELPITIGLAVKHIGQAVEFREESDPQPLTVDLGMGLTLLKKRLTLGLDVNKPRDLKYQFGSGFEWKQPLAKDIRCALRGGYKTVGKDADEAQGFSMGAGLGYRQLDFDFAWVPLGVLGNTFRYSAQMRF